ncbi:MAG: M28 family peptidase, partial [Eudoraea sp.]|nr:M28 family peptidase [Eudoraea sp.]NNJ41636.1 M28 family peptidase [Eudoraea sp.]
MRNSVLLAVILALFFSCKSEKPTPVSLEDDVAVLANDSLAGREPGTQGELTAAAYLQKRMQDLGLEPKGNAGTYYQTFTFKPKTDPHKEVEYTSAGDGTITGTNVIGYIDNQAENTVVIGAHFDHLGMGGQGSLYRGEEPQIHNGADDNASGVAIMLQLADSLRTKHKGNNYLIISFSGEEQGLLGSNYFVKNSTIDLSKVNYMLNMDMVGRLRADSSLSVSGTGPAPVWTQSLNALNTDFKLVLKESGVGPSDH